MVVCDQDSRKLRGLAHRVPRRTRLAPEDHQIMGSRSQPAALARGGYSRDRSGPSALSSLRRAKPASFSPTDGRSGGGHLAVEARSQPRALATVSVSRNPPTTSAPSTWRVCRPWRPSIAPTATAAHRQTQASQPARPIRHQRRRADDDTEAARFEVLMPRVAAACCDWQAGRAGVNEQGGTMVTSTISFLSTEASWTDRAPLGLSAFGAAGCRNRRR